MGRVIALLYGESTNDRWIPRTKGIALWKMLPFDTVIMIEPIIIIQWAGLWSTSVDHKRAPWIMTPCSWTFDLTYISNSCYLPQFDKKHSCFRYWTLLRWHSPPQARKWWPEMLTETPRRIWVRNDSSVTLKGHSVDINSLTPRQNNKMNWLPHISYSWTHFIKHNMFEFWFPCINLHEFYFRQWAIKQW